MNWGAFIEHLAKIFPRLVIVQPDHIGVFIRCGKVKRELGPGVVFCWPYFDEVETATAVTQVLKLPHQSLQSKDGKLMVVTCSVVYKLQSPSLSITKVDDLDLYMEAVIGGRVAKYINATSSGEITVVSVIKNVLSAHFLKKILEDWGVEIDTLFVSNLTQHRPIRILSEYKIED